MKGGILHSGPGSSRACPWSPGPMLQQNIMGQEPGIGELLTSWQKETGW
jgi:hypothetical protein